MDYLLVSILEVTYAAQLYEVSTIGNEPHLAGQP